MSETRVVHCMREKYDVYIGRANKKAGLQQSYWANRFGEEDLELYENDFLDKLAYQDGFAYRVMNLHGKTLGCWCKGTHDPKCHGDIIAHWADLLFAKWEELKPDGKAMRKWIMEQLDAPEPRNTQLEDIREKARLRAERYMKGTR